MPAESKSKKVLGAARQRLPDPAMADANASSVRGTMGLTAEEEAQHKVDIPECKVQPHRRPKKETAGHDILEQPRKKKKKKATAGGGCCGGKPSSDAHK